MESVDLLQFLISPTKAQISEDFVIIKQIFKMSFSEDIHQINFQGTLVTPVTKNM